MKNNDALKKFYECACNNDLPGCLETLQHISIDTLNQQDDDGYTMLISAVVSNNACAVKALLQDNRCDRTIEENLCGMTAEEFAMDYSKDSSIRQAFFNAPMQKFVYRDGKVIDRNDIFNSIMNDTIECDKGCFDMLLGDYYRAELVVNNKVSKKDFESWLNPAQLEWDGQIALLIGDEKYGKKFVSWGYIRKAADANSWLSFLRDLPQYADKANWNKLIKEGSKASWKALVKARPEFKEKFEQYETYCKKILQKYTKNFYYPPLNLAEACKHNDTEVVKVHLNNTSPNLNKNYIYPMPPGFIAQLPLAAAVKGNAFECIELLLEHGANPDVLCNHKSNYKTPRELAANKPKILELFNIYHEAKND
jgi:hypothetical protein